MVSSLENALKKGQLEVTQAQWLLLFDHIRRDRYNDFHFALHYVDRMLSGLAAEYGLESSGAIDNDLGSLTQLQAHMDARLRSITDAIQHVRIDKVCKLLRQSDLPVEQIARQAGYSNTKYFFVLFKKFTGKTPSQFRSAPPD